MSHQFEELWTRFLEGELEEDGFASLQNLLASDQDLLRHAGDLYEEHRLLGFARNHLTMSNSSKMRFQLLRMTVSNSSATYFPSFHVSRLRSPTGATSQATPTEPAASAVRSLRERNWQRSFLAIAVAVSILLGGLTWFFADRANEPAGGVYVAESTNGVNVPERTSRPYCSRMIATGAQAALLPRANVFHRKRSI